MSRQSTRFPWGARRTFLVALFLLLAHGSAHGADRVAEFLSIPVDAAGAGAGGADVARPESGISPFVNPAAAITPQPDLAFTHVVWLADQSVDALQLRLPLDGGRGGLAFTGRFVDHGSIPRFDAAGEALDALEPRDMSLGVAYALRMGRLSLGAGARYLQEDLDVMRGKGTVFELGGLVDLGTLRLGAAATGLWGSLDYDEGESYRIPRRVALGLSWRGMQSRVEADAQFSHTDEIGGLGTMGVHWHALPGALVLRAGYELAGDAGAVDAFSPFRLGFGVGRGSWGLDYAFVPHEELGAAHMLAIRWTGAH